MIERRRRLQNRILRALPSGEYRRLTARARFVHLRRGVIVHDMGSAAEHVYFPMNGVCGLVLASNDGELFQVGMIGCEGVTSVYRTFSQYPDAVLSVQVAPATAWQLPADVFEREMDERLTLRSVVREFYAAFTCNLMLSAACNRLHSLRQRYCRCLLATADRLGATDVRLTHTQMATMLGTPRPSVTVLSLELKRMGAIAYDRHSLTILDRPQLESMACRCYSDMRGLLGGLLPPRW